VGRLSRAAPHEKELRYASLAEWLRLGYAIEREALTRWEKIGTGHSLSIGFSSSLINSPAAARIFRT